MANIVALKRTAASVPTPVAGYATLFIRDTDNVPCIKDSTGATVPLSGIPPGLYSATTDLTMTTNHLLGRATAGTGAAEEIILGTNLSFTGITLNATSGSPFAADIVVNTVNIGLGNSSIATNTRVGFTALNAVTTGNHLTAAGYESMLNTTTGVDDTAVGYQALKAQTTGNQNTCIGYQAGTAITTGGGTTAIGYTALAFCTTQGANTGVGYRVMRLTTSGAQGVAMGYDALQANSSGNANTGIGYQSLTSNTTGGNNTAIGNRAGYAASANANTTGSNNTYLGHNTVGSAATNSNELVIGANAIGLGSNTAVYGDASITSHNFTAGVVKVVGGATLITTTTALTAGATGNVPTLTAGPVTGNPTKWIAINDNGTTRYIPTW